MSTGLPPRQMHRLDLSTRRLTRSDALTCYCPETGGKNCAPRPKHPTTTAPIPSMGLIAATPPKTPHLGGLMPHLDWILGTLAGIAYLYACFNKWTLAWLLHWGQRHDAHHR